MTNTERVETTKSHGATYLRTSRRWAKVERIGSKWHFAGGWAGEIEADYWQRRDCPTKSLAMIYAHDWVEDR